MKKVMILLRVTKEEKTRYQNAATVEELSLTQWIRMRLENDTVDVLGTLPSSAEPKSRIDIAREVLKKVENKHDRERIYGGGGGLIMPPKRKDSMPCRLCRKDVRDYQGYEEGYPDNVLKCPPEPSNL